MTRRLAVALLAAAGLVASGCASSARSATPSATTARLTTTTASTTTTLPAAQLASDDLDSPLFDPESSPDSPYEDVPVQQIGTISIPAIHLTHPVYEGVWLTVLDHGPGHWPGAALPGEQGNAVFPGHRVTHTHPFLNLDRLHPGDAIVFTMPYGTFTYSVTGTKIVKPSDIQVVDQHAKSEVTLIACHPKHSARQRIVVSGVLTKSVWTDAAKRDAANLASALADAAI